MKVLRAIWIQVIVTVSVLGFVLGCGNPLTEVATLSPKALTVHTASIEPEPIGALDSPLTVTLYAGQTIDVGEVEVWLEDGFIGVRYTTTWLLTETHLDVVTNPADFPRTKKGNPIPGHFAYKATHAPGTSTHTYRVPMEGFEEAEILLFAAHAEVEQWIDGACVNNESAWADGDDFPGANWATYFAGAMPVSIDLTNYWVWFFTPDGEQDEQGPITLGIQQTDSTLETDLFDFEGSFINGDFILESDGLGVHLTGTVSGSGEEIVIEGTYTGEELYGPGEFRMVPFPKKFFGTLVAEGNVDGLDIDINTLYALGGLGEMETDPFPSSSFEVDGWDPHPVYLPYGVYLVLSFGVSGALVADPENPYEAGQWWLGIDWESPSGGLDGVDINYPGKLFINHFDNDGIGDDDGIAGSFNASGVWGWLNGEFDVYFYPEWEP